jgi:hypothetical protein
MEEKQYVCLGTCQAVVTQEQFDNGLRNCGAAVCTLKGQPFTEGKKCSLCGKNFSRNEEHQCQH